MADQVVELGKTDVTPVGLNEAVQVREDQARRYVKAYVFGDDDSPVGGQSRALSETELFASLGDQVLAPPYDPYSMGRIVEQSSELGQCIDAMCANIGAFGYQLPCRIVIDEKTPEDLKATIKQEEVAIRNFLAVAPGGESLEMLREKTRSDLEATGNAYWELVPTLRGDKVVGWNLIPSYQMRLTPQDQEFTRASVKIVLLQEDGSITLETREVYRRFRRFVQGQQAAVTTSDKTTGLASWSATEPSVVSSGSTYRWFKEVGDPRTIDNLTGEVVASEKLRNFDGDGNPMPENRKASAILHWRIYSPRSPYGVPRWVGATMEVLGVRRAEEVNYVTLSNNNIPSLVISVSNGRLTGGTIARIKQFVDTVIRGSSNYSQVLILEGESGLDTADSAEGQVKIDIKPLTASQHTDALFVNYCKNGKDSMRRAFRLPELFVGMSQGLNRATAVEARKLADEQVFAPERAYEDHEINGLLQAQGFFYHKFVSRTPNVTDNETMVGMMAAAERTGGVTPRIARTIVEEAFPSAANAPPLDPRKFDPDVPFSITLAEKVKNQSDPTELNQQGPPVESAIPTDEEKSMTASSGNANSMLREILSFGDQLAASVRREIGKASNEG